MGPYQYVMLLLLWACVAGCGAAPAPAAGPQLAVRGSGGGAQDRLQQPLEGGAGVHSTGGMSMAMTFFGGNNFHLWFDAFHIHDAGTLTAGCIGVAIMAALYEGLKVGRIILADRMDSSTLLSAGHWFQVFLHVVQVTCSYFLMLATMTYSSWIMISVCAGAGVGYAIFALMVPKSRLFGGSAEHCR